MERKKLLQNEPVWIAPPKSITAIDIVRPDVIAASQIVEADGEQAIEIDLFYRGNLQCRYFADKKIYWSWIDGKWHQYKLSNAVRVSKGQDPLTGYWYDCVGVKWHMDEDRERVYDFLGKSADRNEAIICGAKYQRALRRKTERINKEMDQVPPVPEEAEAWAKTTLFPENYLFIDRKGSRTDYICTACGKKSWTKKTPKHRQKTICPKCGASVTVELRRERIEETKPLVILQSYERNKEFLGIPMKEKVWIERQFKARCAWEKEKAVFLFEEIRVIIPEGETKGKVYYGQKWYCDELEQEFWHKNSANKQFLKSWLYPGNLKDVLPIGGLEHRGIYEMAAAGERFRVNRCILYAKEWPWMEYLAKAGLTALAEDILEKYWWNPRQCINTDAKVSVKCKNADAPNIMTWEEFAGLVIDIFPAAGERTWENYFGGDEETEEPATEKDEPIGAAGHECQEDTEEIAEKTTEGAQEAGYDQIKTASPDDIATENIPRPTEDEAAATEAEPTEPEGPNTEAEFAAGPEEQIPEEKTAAEEENSEGTAIAPAQLSAVKIEVGFAERENLRSAYLSLATIALRLEKDYPGDIRETAEGVHIYNAAMGIKEILSWAGVEVEDLFENCGGTD